MNGLVLVLNRHLTLFKDKENGVGPVELGNCYLSSSATHPENGNFETKRMALVLSKSEVPFLSNRHFSRDSLGGVTLPSVELQTHATYPENGNFETKRMALV